MISPTPRSRPACAVRRQPPAPGFIRHCAHCGTTSGSGCERCSCARVHQVMHPVPNLRHCSSIPSKLYAGIAVVVAVLVALGTGVAATLQSHVRPLDAGAIALIVLAALALAWHERAPVATLSVVVTLVSAYLLTGYPY